MTEIATNDFVRRQTKESEFTHYDGTWASLERLTEANFHKAKPGYRDGVCLVPMPDWACRNFYCGIMTLQEGDKLVGEYKRRQPDEEPRKTIRAKGRDLGPGIGVVGKSACKAVDIVLYRRDVLEEGGEDCTGCEWDIISINGRLTEEEMPIHPNTLIANHFQLSGGTATNMSPEEFEKALRESVLFWKDKAILAKTNS